MKKNKMKKNEKNKINRIECFNYSLKKVLYNSGKSD